LRQLFSRAINIFTNAGKDPSMNTSRYQGWRGSLNKMYQKEGKGARTGGMDVTKTKKKAAGIGILARNARFGRLSH
jgi:hypothetical protein